MKNKTPKLSLTNELWIVHIHDLLPKLTPIKESLIVEYWCRTTLIKLRNFNDSLTSQKASRRNISNFAQNHDAAMALIWFSAYIIEKFVT
jgi:hypothetical protein